MVGGTLSLENDGKHLLAPSKVMYDPIMLKNNNN